MKKISLETCMGILVLVCVLFLSTKGVEKGIQTSGTAGRETIVVDAGHGGSDPGKVGVNNAQEKEINLSIAKKLRDYLEQEGYGVVMTRKEDAGLHAAAGTGSKKEDMQNRCALIEKTAPVLTVSIHQNSYTDASVCGPQVFYYTTSKEGEEIAKCIQDVMNQELQIAKPRTIKGNDTYYLLKRSASPTVIVECGFLSNYEEAEKLLTDSYQQDVARAVGKGVIQYLTSR